MSSKPKPAPARPAPRLYLATPVVDDPAALVAELPKLLAGADVAAVLVRLKARDPRGMTECAKALVRPIQDAGAAALLDGHPELVARAGADAMVAGEAGADYVLFGEPDAAGPRPASEAIADRLTWWAEIFEVPCVGFATNLTEVAAFAGAGADFILVGDMIWNDVRGAHAALVDAHNAIRQNSDGTFGA